MVLIPTTTSTRLSLLRISQGHDSYEYSILSLISSHILIWNYIARTQRRIDWLTVIADQSNPIHFNVHGNPSGTLGDALFFLGIVDEKRGPLANATIFS